MTVARWTARRAAASGFLTLIVWLSGGCAVHHHHHYPPESQAPSEVPGAQVERSGTETAEPRAASSSAGESAETAEASSGAADPGDQDVVPELQAEAQPVATPTSSDDPAGRFEPFEDCAVDDDVTGWVVVDCPDQNYLVQTGPTMRGSFDRRFAYAGQLATKRHPKEVAYWGKVSDVRLNQTRYRAMQFELRESRDQGFGLSAPDEEGEVVAEGMYAAADSALGAIGMLCVEDGQLDRAECLRVFEALSSAEELPFGKAFSTKIEVLGWTLESEGDCYFSHPGRIDCMTGHLSWTPGDREDLDNKLNETIAVWTDDGGIPGFHNPHTTGPCELAGQATTCHRVEYKGVRDEPGEILHLAIVQEAEEEVLVRCSYSTRYPVPEPCRQAFSDAR
ncbi:hypothetical protein FRC98_17970 [Lujinxingia vulgaris]|uniref:Uncharacterized protein n=1 Tax=Lujinxingia vulgaris TaxID=2600176 RepID=A0A5C6X377_9DELT|nr:hypothetical protein [Lujinxingia vulgaris]TXD34720.1 hypothetical protein FRC98_17970 [Lujinxingia vulgaris]